MVDTAFSTSDTTKTQPQFFYQAIPHRILARQRIPYYQYITRNQLYLSPIHQFLFDSIVLHGSCSLEELFCLFYHQIHSQLLELKSSRQSDSKNATTSSTQLPVKSPQSAAISPWGIPFDNQLYTSGVEYQRQFFWSQVLHLISRAILLQSNAVQYSILPFPSNKLEKVLVDRIRSWAPFHNVSHQISPSIPLSIWYNPTTMQFSPFSINYTPRKSGSSDPLTNEDITAAKLRALELESGPHLYQAFYPTVELGSSPSSSHQIKNENSNTVSPPKRFGSLFSNSHYSIDPVSWPSKTPSYFSSSSKINNSANTYIGLNYFELNRYIRDLMIIDFIKTFCGTNESILVKSILQLHFPSSFSYFEDCTVGLKIKTVKDQALTMGLSDYAFENSKNSLLAFNLNLVSALPNGLFSGSIISHSDANSFGMNLSSQAKSDSKSDGLPRPPQSIHDFIFSDVDNDPMTFYHAPHLFSHPQVLQIVNGNLIVLHIRAILAALQRVSIENFVKEKYGQTGLRIYRCLVMHSGLDSHEISNRCLAPLISVNNILWSLKRDGIIGIHEIPRSKLNYTPMKVLGVWYVLHSQLRQNFCSLILQSMRNIFSRYIVELAKYKEWKSSIIEQHFHTSEKSFSSPTTLNFDQEFSSYRLSLGPDIGLDVEPANCANIPNRSLQLLQYIENQASGTMNGSGSQTVVQGHYYARSLERLLYVYHSLDQMYLLFSEFNFSAL